MIREIPGTVRDRLLLAVIVLPWYLRGLLVVGVFVGACGWLLVDLTYPLRQGIAGAVGVTIAVVGPVWLWYPSESQLRHRLADDPIITIPLKESGDRYEDPEGSPSLVVWEMDRSMLVLGETGSGKTKAIEVLAHQMQAGDDDALVAFDYKEDYQDFFPDDRVVRLSSVDSDVGWNVINELRHYDDCEEVARIVFASANSSYFADSAAQVFRDILEIMRREAESGDNDPTNADLVDFIEANDLEGIRKRLEAEEMPAAKHLTEEAEASHNILSNLEKQVSKVFTGDFKGDGSFSVRQYMQNPDGRILILDLPVDQSESVKPIFRLLIDWSIRFGLLDERGSYYILDEFAALPELDMLERLANAGRAYNCYAIAGVQDMAQVRDTYGREGAQGLMSGFAQEIHLRVDQSSVGYWRSALGRERRIRGDNDDDERPEESVAEEQRISESKIQNLKAGEGVVHTTSGWQRGRLYMLEEVEKSLLPSSRTRARDAIAALRGSNRPAIEEGDAVTDGGETTIREAADGGE